MPPWEEEDLIKDVLEDYEVDKKNKMQDTQRLPWVEF